jgi:hypothetical protein
LAEIMSSLRKFQRNMNNLMKNSLVVVGLLFVVMLTGCKGDEKDIPIQDQTMSGIDANKNGIRDDIEDRMKVEFTEMVTPEEQYVMDQSARVFQEILDLNLDDREKVLLVRDHLDMSINCGVLVFGEDFRYDNYSIILTRLKQWYFNTKMRKEKQKEFIMRSKEYHYEKTNFGNANTCEFEFSPALIKEIERRDLEKKAKEEAQKKLESSQK